MQLLGFIPYNKQFLKNNLIIFLNNKFLKIEEEIF